MLRDNGDAASDFDTVNEVYKEIFKYVLYRHYPEGKKVINTQVMGSIVVTNSSVHICFSSLYALHDRDPGY